MVRVTVSGVQPWEWWLLIALVALDVVTHALDRWKRVLRQRKDRQRG